MKNGAPKADPVMRMLLGLVVGLVVVGALLMRAAFRIEAPGEELTLSRLYRGCRRRPDRRGHPPRARGPGGGEVLSQRFPGHRRARRARRLVVPGAGQRVPRAYPRSEVVPHAVIDRIGARAPVELDRQAAKQVGRQLLTFVWPPLLLVTLVGLVLVSRGNGSSVMEAAGLGRITRRRRREQAAETAVTLADVAGAQHAVGEVAEVISYLRDPARFQAVGATAPTGVLLSGPPGCGKTLLARAVAGESAVPFLSMAGAHCPAPARVRDLFAQARQLAPAVCFIDDLDALGSRNGGEGGGGGEAEQALHQLLVEMDALERSSGVVVIAATNRPQVLEPALSCRGRFDRHISLQPPDAAGRRAILAIQAKDRPLAPEVDLDQVAARTAGFTGATWPTCSTGPRCSPPARG